MTLYTANLGQLLIGPTPIPGVIQPGIEIDGREINWQVQAGVSGLGAATIFRGVKLIENIKVKTLLAIPGKPQIQWDEAVALWTAFLRAIWPVTTVKPPAWDVDHPLFTLVYPPVSRVAHKLNRIVPFNSANTAWLAELTLIEYKPLKLAKPGPPDPAKIDGRDKPPKDAMEAEIEDLLNKAKNL